MLWVTENTMLVRSVDCHALLMPCIVLFVLCALVGLEAILWGKIFTFLTVRFVQVLKNTNCYNTGIFFWTKRYCMLEIIIYRIVLILSRLLHVVLFSFSYRMHSLYGAKISLRTINIEGRNTAENGRKTAENRRKWSLSCCRSITTR